MMEINAATCFPCFCLFVDSPLFLKKTLPTADEMLRSFVTFLRFALSEVAAGLAPRANGNSWSLKKMSSTRLSPKGFKKT